MTEDVKEEEVLTQEQANEPTQVETQEPPEKEQTVPLATYMNERKKRQEAQLEADWHKQQALNLQQSSQALQEDDADEYETVTKKDLKQWQEQQRKQLQEESFNAERTRLENAWAAENPEKTVYVDQNLETFLKQHRHLATAINSVPNRYEEAYKLMDALSPKQRKEMETPKEKKPAPNAASAVPKSTVMKQTEDVMSMSDSEFLEWRKSKRRSR
jgi:hypothetical protein